MSKVFKSSQTVRASSGFEATLVGDIMGAHMASGSRSYGMFGQPGRHMDDSGGKTTISKQILKE